ncbi:unnamed protein product [Pylaiella littoralis]
MPGYGTLMLLLAVSSAHETALLGLDLVEDRTADMIESIFADMSINFMEEALLQSAVPVGGGGGDGDHSSGGGATKDDTVVVFPSYSLTDIDGVVHTCTVREEPEQAKSSRKGPTNVKVDLSTALDPLKGACATLSNGQFWSYRWCHRQDIVQFHQDGESTTALIRLGRHAKTEVKRANDNATPANFDSADAVDETGASWVSRVFKKTKGGSGSGRKSNSDGAFHGINDFSEVAAVFDFYEEGDFCDEIGVRRSVKTAITCCSTDREAVNGQHPLATFVSIQEVSVCSYVARVCSQLLCPALSDNVTYGREGKGGVSKGEAVMTAVGQRADGVLGILQRLEACFPVKKDVWWSYKLCLSKGISQFHDNVSMAAEKARVTKITSSLGYTIGADEFSLGKWDISTVKGDGKHLIRSREQGADEEGGTIVLEFTGGTECDLTGMRRSSTVHLKCGPEQMVRNVVEDRTCHYRVLAYSPHLCSHAALMPPKAAIRTVECVAEGTNARGKP